MSRLINKRKLLFPYLHFNKKKIFCIGLNKTGTTSLHRAMKDFGYTIGRQREAELLFDDWVRRDFRKIFNYCRSAEFFQDAPFSLPYTFIVLDQYFPGSKFILTVRDNKEQWYNVITKFHAKKWGKDGRIPTAEDLKNANYIYKGFPYYSRMHINNVTENDPYNKDILYEFYESHIKLVRDYFRFREKDLLIINVSERKSYYSLCNFLNKKPLYNEFPWENKT